MSYRIHTLTQTHSYTQSHTDILIHTAHTEMFTLIHADTHTYIPAYTHRDAHTQIQYIDTPHTKVHMHSQRLTLTQVLR